MHLKNFSLQTPIVFLLGVYLFLNLVRDSGIFYPPVGANAYIFVISSTFALFAVSVWFFLYKSPWAQFSFITNIGKLVQKHKYLLTGTFFALLIIFIAGLHWRSSQVFTDFYQWGSLEFFVFITAAIAIWIAFLSKNIKVIFMVIVLLFLAIKIVPIANFQITAQVADLMPIVEKQLSSFISGENIYQYYELDNGVKTQAVRQPGTTLSYLPAFILNIDLRWMSVIYTLATGVILFIWSKREANRKTTLMPILITGLWLLMPYHHLRHDLYEPFHWLVMTSSLYFLYYRKYLVMSLLWGIGIFTQVWFWLFTPLLFIYLWRQLKIKKALYIVAVSLLLGGGLLAVFILQNPAAYTEHVFGFYQGEVMATQVAPNVVYLTPLIYSLQLNNYLLLLQVLVVFTLGFTALFRLKSYAGLIRYFVVVLLGFVAFNSVSWNYMYINLILLMLVYLVIKSHIKKFDTHSA